MKKINDGGPAFPVPAQDMQSTGMTLRAYLAGKALQGIMSQPNQCSTFYAEVNADIALSQADALIAKLWVQS